MKVKIFYALAFVILVFSGSILSGCSSGPGWAPTNPCALIVPPWL